MIRISICGGGSLSHAVAAVLGAHGDVEVRVLTRQPERWSGKVRAIYLDIAEIVGRVSLASSDPQQAVAGADMVILCVPSCARGQVLTAIAPFVREHTRIGCFPGFGGFEWQARNTLGGQARIFGLQRVPYVRKTISYGEAVWISGIRPRLFVGTLPASDAAEVARLLETLLSIPSDPLPTYLPVTLSASNAIFHPARIYSAFAGLADQARLSERKLFYEDWDDDASVAYLSLDQELQAICARIPADMSAAEPIQIHYGVDGVAALTQRIRTIRALRDRHLPLLRDAEGFFPDVFSSYFTEDIPFGLLVVKAVAQTVGVRTPHIDGVLHWAQRAMNRSYLTGERIDGADVAGLPLPGHFGITDAGSLLSAAQ
jgi:opine dehydrogenase